MLTLFIEELFYLLLRVLLKRPEIFGWPEATSIIDSLFGDVHLVPFHPALSIRVTEMEVGQ